MVPQVMIIKRGCPFEVVDICRTGGHLRSPGGIALVLTPASRADAAPRTPYWALSPIDVNNSGVTGDIYWYNRTAEIEGVVYDRVSGTSTVAVFEAFVGETKTSSTTRTADDEAGQELRQFGFTIGDSDMRGDLTRIKISVCHYYKTAAKTCRSTNYSRK